MTERLPSNAEMEEWQVAAFEYAKGKGFWDDFPIEAVRQAITQKFPIHLYESNYIAAKLALIHSEVSEALEALRDNAIGLEIDVKNGCKPEGVASELADIIIRTLDLAEALGLDMGHAMAVKMEYNATRPANHGKAL